MKASAPGAARSVGKAAGRLGLAAFMVFAGVSHFVAHESFLQQLPTWVPARLWIVWVTGVMEVALGLGLLALPRYRHVVGWVLAIFLLAVFPANIYQALSGSDAFGLDTSAARWARLLFQPPLIFLALWSTSAWPSRGRPRGEGATQSLSAM